MRLISEPHEIQLGAQNYSPMQQTQGGTQNVFPELNTYVDGVGQRLAEVSDRPHLPYEFVVLNNGVPNAWALPGGKIAVNRALLTELQNEAELAAVLGHEIVHAAARHGAQSMERGIILQAGLIGLGLSIEDHDYRDVILGAAGISANLVGLKYSRAAEMEADRYGIRYMADAGYDPRAAVTLQETFVRLSEGRSPGWLEGLFASHPPSRERVEANRKIVAALPNREGVLNADEYRTAVASLREAQPAYDAMTAGYKALEEGRTDQALRFANQAIDILPREAKFYALAAEAHARAGNHREAETQLNQALTYNPQYFGFYLQRGLARQALGDTRGAQQDLSAGNRLLPTAQAYTALGVMALEAQDPGAALEYFRIGADANSPAGRESLRMLARMELPSRPERYIQVTVHRTPNGYLSMRAVNHSPVPVSAIQVSVDVYNPDGSLASRIPVNFPDVVPPGETGHAPTRIGRFTSDEHLAGSVRVHIRSARVAE